jgi:hypothetical protein
LGHINHFFFLSFVFFGISFSLAICDERLFEFIGKLDPFKEVYTMFLWLMGIPIIYRSSS